MGDPELERLEQAVARQPPVASGDFDRAYYQGSWRAGGERYDLASRREVEGPHPQLVRDVLAPATLLDVGCGPGLLLALLAELGVRGCGADSSTAAVELAPPSVRSRIDVADATMLPHAAGAFDVVLCRETLEHLRVPDLTRVVGELCRVSTRLVYVTTRFHPQPRDLVDLTNEADVDPTHITLLDKRLVRLLFVLHGLRRRADLEEAMDWAGKNRVLVYEHAA